MSYETANLVFFSLPAEGADERERFSVDMGGLPPATALRHPTRHCRLLLLLPAPEVHQLWLRGLAGNAAIAPARPLQTTHSGTLLRTLTAVFLNKLWDAFVEAQNP